MVFPMPDHLSDQLSPRATAAFALLESPRGNDDGVSGYPFLSPVSWVQSDDHSFPVFYQYFLYRLFGL